jgi:Protein of unknown function (DUF3099)
MIKYSLAMGIRMICLLSLLFVQGWWLVIMAAGAILLPYVAVVLANVGARPGDGAVAPSGREVMIRNPQAPIVVPPAEEQAAQSGGQHFSQTGEQPFPQAGGQPFPQPEQHFPSAGEQPFPQPERPFEQPPARPADRPGEGQA